MNEMTFQEFAAAELKDWNNRYTNGQEIPPIVTRVLETSYHSYLRTTEKGKEEETKVEKNFLKNLQKNRQ